MSDPDLIHVIDELRRQCEELQEKVGRLEEAVQFLVYAKKTDPRFAFYDWLVGHDVFGRRHARLQHVLGVLDSRLKGRPFTVQKSLAGIDDDELYRAEPPTRDEARNLLMQALEINNPDIIDRLLEALRTQTPDRELVIWWWNTPRS